MPNENFSEILNLIKENPDLPIVPMVDSEIVCAEGHNRWLGAWGESYIDEYLIGHENVYFRDNDDSEQIYRILCEEYEEEAITGLSEKEIKEAHASLPWIKAIIVNINTI